MGASPDQSAIESVPDHHSECVGQRPYAGRFVDDEFGEKCAVSR